MQKIYYIYETENVDTFNKIKINNPIIVFVKLGDFINYRKVSNLLNLYYNSIYTLPFPEMQMTWGVYQRHRVILCTYVDSDSFRKIFLNVLTRNLSRELDVILCSSNNENEFNIIEEISSKMNIIFYIHLFKKKSKL